MRIRYKLFALGGVLAGLAIGCGSGSSPPAETTAADAATSADANCPLPDSGPVVVADVAPAEVANADSAPVDTGPKADPILELGQFQNPLVLLKRVQGAVNHLHVDEVRYRAFDKRLFQCSYTFGVIDETDPAKPAYLSENLKHTVAGDKRTPGCIHLSADGNYVWTTHRGNLSNPTFISGWDITDPKKPVQGPVLQEKDEQYEGVDVPFQATGTVGLVYVALKQNGMGVYKADAKHNLVRQGSVSGLGSTWGLRVVGNIVYVTDILGTMSTVDVSDPTKPKMLGTVAIGGNGKGITVEGGIAYIAAGEAGLVVVDVADPAKPKVLATVKTPGIAVRTAYASGRVYVAAWNDTRVYDVSTPSAPKFIGAVRIQEDLLNTPFIEPDHPFVTSRTLGVAAVGDVMFVGNWVNQYNYRVIAERIAPNLVVPEDANLVDFGPIAPGKTKTLPFVLRNQGTAPLTLYNNWLTNKAFSVTPKQMRLAPGQEGTLSLSYTATSTVHDWAVLNMYSDDPAQPLRTAFLGGNMAGVSIGKPFPLTTVQLLDGNTWTSSSVKNKVMLLGYFATF